jgi:hypothetical protein
MSYVPPQEILERYAEVLIGFALGGGRGVAPGEVVRLAGRRARDRRLPTRRRQSDQYLSRLLPAGRREPARPFRRALHPRAGRSDGPSGHGAGGQRPACAGLGRSGEHHAAWRRDAPAARLARREGECRPLHLDARPVRHAGDGRRGRHRPGGVLGADRSRMLSRRRRSDRPLARGRRASAADPPAS